MFSQITAYGFYLCVCVCVLLSAGDIGPVLAAEMRKRIMVIDGAMGTMIQNEGLDEADFRGTVHLCILSGIVVTCQDVFMQLLN